MFKRFVFCIAAITSVARADTITVEWLGDDGTTASTTTCESGGNLTLPNYTPTKTGYNFVGWEIPKYYPLEYIENVPGASMLDTGFMTNENTKIVVDYIKISMPADGSNSRCPVITGDKVGILGALSKTYPSYTYVIFGDVSTDNTNYNLGSNAVRHTSSLSKNGWYINNKKVRNISTTPFISTRSLMIFNNNTCTERFYSLQLYQNEVLVHDYVPAMKPDGTVCLYDKVTDSFLYNSGTEPLVGGPILDYD